MTSLAAALGIVVAVATTVVAADATVAELIDQLGSAEWVERERATDALLDLGVEAVPTLRTVERHDDPEIRTRVDHLLRELDPWIYDLRISRLVPTPDGRREVSAVNDVTLVAHSGAAQTISTTAGPDPDSVALTVSANGEGDPVTVSVTFGTGDQAPVEARAVRDGGAVMIRREDRIDVELADGIQRSVATTIWVLELRRAARRAGRGAELETATTTEAHRELRERLTELLDMDSTDRVALALELIGWLGDEELLAAAREREPDWSPELRIASQLARLAAGDRSAAEPMERWLLGEAPEDRDPRRAEGAIHLTRLGSSTGLDTLLAEIGEMPGWLQYRAVQAIVDRWTGAEGDETAGNGTGEDDVDGFSPDQRRDIFAAITAPEVFGFLPWYSDGLIEQLFVLLMDGLPFETTRATFFDRLADSGVAGSGGLIRLRALLNILRDLQSSGQVDPERWLPIVVEQLPNAGATDNALRVISAAIRSDALTEDHWETLQEAFDAAFAGEDQAVQRRIDNLFSDLLAIPEIPIEVRRRLWRSRALRLPALEGKLSYQRRSIDQSLARAFGELEERAPNVQNSPAWKERSDQWLAKLSTLEDDQWLPEVDAEPLVLVEAELRLDPEEPARVLRYDRYVVTPGRAVPRNEPGEAPATIALETVAASPAMRQRPGYAPRYTISRMTTYLDVPRLIGSVRRHRGYRFVLSDGDFRPRTVPNASGLVQYRTLSWLLPGDTPVETWQDTVDALVDASASDLLQRRNESVKILADLRLEAALPRLRELYAEDPLETLGLALLRLGDTRARDALLEGIENKRSNDAREILKALATIGDEEAIDILLRWLVDPPRTMRGQMYGFVQAVEKLALADPTRADSDQWIDALIGSLQHTNAQRIGTQALRRITGEDFGFGRTYQEYPNAAERRTAEAAIIESWREWHRKRKASDSRREG